MGVLTTGWAGDLFHESAFAVALSEAVVPLAHDFDQLVSCGFLLGLAGCAPVANPGALDRSE
jgi:hypothetical protein